MVPTLTETKTRIFNAGSYYSTFLNWLDSVTAASLLPSASYIKWAVFFVGFYSRHFGAGERARLTKKKPKSVFFDFSGMFLLTCIETKNACPPEGDGSTRPHKDRGIGEGVSHDVGAGRSEGQPQGPDVILRMRVFCFLVKKERDVNGVAGLT